MMRLLPACGALCLASAAGVDSGVALVQVQVQSHSRGESAAPDGPAGPQGAEFLVDNSGLAYQGPGVLYRSKKDMEGIVNRTFYAAWGTTVRGFDEGDGWVKVGGYYLPAKALGHQVLRVQEPPKPTPQVPQLPPWEGPSEALVSDDTWLPCNVTGAGREMGTFNVVMTPINMREYAVTDMRLEKLRKAAPKIIAPITTPPPANGNEAITLNMEDSEAGKFKVKLVKKARFIAAMNMACDYGRIHRDECRSTVLFKHNGKEIHPDKHILYAGLQDNDTIVMHRM